MCDVGDRSLVEQTVAEVGRRVGPVAAMTAVEFADALATNFWGMVHATLAVLPEMRRRRRGRIVNITSIGGKVAVPRLLPYTASKFAAVGFSEGLAAELAGDGIVVVTVAPGLMRTGSYLHAEFKGDTTAEARWFALSSTLSGVSMDAERAARQIVRATRRGERVRVLTPPAAALAALHGVLPGATVALLGLVNRLVLPDPDVRPGRAVSGAALEPRHPAWLRVLTRLGRSAAHRFGQYARSRSA